MHAPPPRGIVVRFRLPRLTLSFRVGIIASTRNVCRSGDCTPRPAASCCVAPGGCGGVAVRVAAAALTHARRTHFDFQPSDGSCSDIDRVRSVVFLFLSVSAQLCRLPPASEPAPSVDGAHGANGGTGRCCAGQSAPLCCGQQRGRETERERDREGERQPRMPSMEEYKGGLGKRWLVLLLSSFMMVGSYYCYDNPSALNSQARDLPLDPCFLPPPLSPSVSVSLTLCACLCCAQLEDYFTNVVPKGSSVWKGSIQPDQCLLLSTLLGVSPLISQPSHTETESHTHTHTERERERDRDAAGEQVQLLLQPPLHGLLGDTERHTEPETHGDRETQRDTETQRHTHTERQPDTHLFRPQPFTHTRLTSLCVGPPSAAEHHPALLRRLPHRQALGAPDERGLLPLPAHWPGATHTPSLHRAFPATHTSSHTNLIAPCGP
eukprot:COSAG03_NODE_2151_length_3073_cov_3.145259_2_plen_436_part_00